MILPVLNGNIPDGQIGGRFATTHEHGKGVVLESPAMLVGTEHNPHFGLIVGWQSRDRRVTWNLIVKFRPCYGSVVNTFDVLAIHQRTIAI